LDRREQPSRITVRMPLLSSAAVVSVSFSSERYFGRHYEVFGALVEIGFQNRGGSIFRDNCCRNLNYR
jgi:hypothetical protein